MIEYDIIFKYFPGPGLIFSDFISKSRYGRAGLFSLYHDGVLEVYANKRDEQKINRQGLSFFSSPARFDRYKREVASISSQLALFCQNIDNQDWQTLSDRELKKIFNETVDQFVRYLGYYFYTEFFCFELIEKRINQVFESKFSGEDLRSKLEVVFMPSDQFSSVHIGKQPVDLLEQQRRIIMEMNLSPKDRHLIKVVQEMQEIKYEFRKLLNKFFFGDEAVISKLVKEIGRRCDLARNQLYFLTIKEVGAILSGRKTIDVKEISARQRCYFADRRHLYSGDRAKSFIGKVKPERLTDVKTIFGSIANHGIAQGRAKIIRLTTDADITKREIDKMEEGQILVADSTGPELILACKKAIAIVADEGGINSHAAIISRELGIPCIVGTKIATKVLKDGDIVEVDANKGIIRKISN